MLTPYTIVRSCPDPGVFIDALGGPLRGIDGQGLTLLFGDVLDPAAHAEAYMESVSAIHEVDSCVPIRLGEPLEKTDAARRLLQTGAERFARLLDRFDDTDEWSIWVQAPTTPEPIGASSSDAEFSDDSDGRGYLERRRRALDAQSGIASSVTDVLAEFTRTLGPHARDTRTIATRDGGGSLALLFDRSIDAPRLFQSASVDLALSAVLTGPWPPYSFVSLQA